MRRRMLIAGSLVVTLAALAYAQVRPDSESESSPAYRVTAYPQPVAPAERYTQLMDQYLNRMAEDGWLFHSVVESHNLRMMVFERKERR